MAWLKKHEQIIVSLLHAGLTFAVLTSLLLVAIERYDFSGIRMDVLAFILAMSCIVFLSKTVYQIGAGSARAKKVAEGMMQKMLRNSEQLFTEVYSNSPVAYLIVSTTGEIESANIAATRLFGHTAPELVSQNLFTLVDTGNEEHQAVLRQKFKSGVVITEEEVKISRGNAFSWTQVSMFPFNGEDGKKLHLVTLVDTTKQKEIDIAKSEFVSLASHQLRTPISGMRWSAELLLRDEEGVLTDAQKRYVERLLASIQRMSTLVDEFLQVSRFELGTRVLKAEPVMLRNLFEEIYLEQETNAAKKSLQITKEYDADILEIQSDIGLVRMIVTNLYTNAIKYSKEGGEILLAFRKKGEELEIEVKDSGMGIPESEQERVFSKIFRASNAIKEVPDGTGLGLYIVHKAVEKLQGRITFLSAEGVGTSFVVTIPLVQ